MSAVAPAFVRTALVEPLMADPAMRQAILDATPLGRLVEPEEVASAIVFLASDAASMITGHTLPVDGGWLARQAASTGMCPPVADLRQGSGTCGMGLGDSALSAASGKETFTTSD